MGNEIQAAGGDVNGGFASEFSDNRPSDFS